MSALIWKPIDDVPLLESVLLTDGDCIIIRFLTTYDQIDEEYSWVTHWMQLPEPPEKIKDV